MARKMTDQEQQRDELRKRLVMFAEAESGDDHNGTDCNNTNQMWDEITHFIESLADEAFHKGWNKRNEMPMTGAEELAYKKGYIDGGIAQLNSERGDNE